MKALLKAGTVCLLAAAVLFGMSAGAAAQEKEQQEKPAYAALLGTWELSVDMGDYYEKSEFVFTARNDSLFGKWMSLDGPIPLKKVEFADNELKCRLSVPDDMGGWMTIYVKGKIEKDEIKGSGSAEDGMMFPFTGKKLKKKDGKQPGS